MHAAPIAPGHPWPPRHQDIHEKDLSRLVIEVIGEKADERTPYLTKITLICNITSLDADQAFIASILEKAPERCPVLITLRQGLEIVVQGNYAV